LNVLKNRGKKQNKKEGKNPIRMRKVDQMSMGEEDIRKKIVEKTIHR